MGVTLSRSSWSSWQRSQPPVQILICTRESPYFFRFGAASKAKSAASRDADTDADAPDDCDEADDVTDLFFDAVGLTPMDGGSRRQLEKLHHAHGFSLLLHI